MSKALLKAMKNAEKAAKRGDMHKASQYFDVASKLSLAIEQGVTSESSYAQYLIMCASGRLLD